MEQAMEAMADMEELYGPVPFVKRWHEVMKMGRQEIAKLIVRRNDGIETLRETSPFMRVFDFDYGINMRIDFKDPAIRHRMWNLAKRLATIEPYQPELPTCRPMTPF